MRPETQGSDALQDSLLRDRILADKIRLTEEVVEAMYEKDIMSLRQELAKAAKQVAGTSREHVSENDAFFCLSEEIASPVDLMFENQEAGIGNYLQQLHLRNHSFASKEVVHDMFSEVEEDLELDDLLMSEEDELLFGELREAMTEKEVIDLRVSLQSIAMGISKNALAFEESDDLVSDEFDEVLESLMQEDSSLRAALSIKVLNQKEIESAITEYDDVFESLMQEDSRIRTALSIKILHQKEIESAIAELDVMKLRADLKNIAQQESVKETRIIHLDSPGRKMLYWSAAASIAVLLAFTALFQTRGTSEQELFASNDQPYKNGLVISRSASTSTSLLSLALREMDSEDYTTALNLLNIAAADEKNGFAAKFYAGEVYQKLGDYKNAIKSYSAVVQHGDNLLVEQSQWAIGLCYLKMNEKAEAARQFNSIVASKGYYSEKSRELMNQLR